MPLPLFVTSSIDTALQDETLAEGDGDSSYGGDSSHDDDTWAIHVFWYSRCLIWRRDSGSSTASVSESILDYREVHGRTFQNFKTTEYWYVDVMFMQFEAYRNPEGHRMMTNKMNSLVKPQGILVSVSRTNIEQILG